MRVFDPVLRALGRLRLWQQFVLLGLFVVTVPIISTTMRFLKDGQEILTQHEIIDLSDESNLRVNEIREEFDYLLRDVARAARQLNEKNVDVEKCVRDFAKRWPNEIAKPGEPAGDMAKVRHRYFGNTLIESQLVTIEPTGFTTTLRMDAAEVKLVGVIPKGSAVDVAVAEVCERVRRESPSHISGLHWQPKEGTSPGRCVVVVGWPVRWVEGRPTHLFAVVVDFTRYIENRRGTSPRHQYIVTQPDGTVVVHPAAEFAAKRVKLSDVIGWNFPVGTSWVSPAETKADQQRRYAQMLKEGGSRLAGVTDAALTSYYRKGYFGTPLSAKLGQNARTELSAINQWLAAEVERDPPLRYGELTESASYVEISHPDLQRLLAISQHLEKWWSAGEIDWIDPLLCKTFQGQLTYLRMDANDEDEPPRLLVAASLEELHEDIDSKFWRIVTRWVIPTVAISAILTVLLVVVITSSLSRLAKTADTLSDPSVSPTITGGGCVEVTQLAGALQGMARRLFGMNEQLESRVKLRTAELAETNTKLEVALRQAEAAGRAKDTFVANMSHELRQPLHIIIGFTEALKEEAVDANHAELIPDLNKILTAAKHLLDLINDILDLAKISAGRMELMVATFDLTLMVRDVQTLVAPLAGKHANQFVVDVPNALGVMIADERRVRQILINLLSNAFKFTTNGTVTLQVRRVQKNSHEMIEFAVADTGKGMTADQVSRLFQRFYQADPSTTREQGGTGLGLAITQSFNDVMGGDPIHVSSVPDQGSHFVVRLPAVVEPNVAKNIARATPTELTPIVSKSDSQTLTPVNAGTILVIDDDPMVHELMLRFLSKEGFRVVSALTGAEGLRIARDTRPSAITLDVMMPEVDGWSVLADLKADPLTCDIPVVMLTIVDDRGRGYALGAADYLTKPIDWQRLAVILRRYQSLDRASPVLVIDDDPECREMVRRYLEREGWRVTEAPDGEAGLREMATEFPALILLDLMMPVLDGFSFLTELPHRFPGARVPVVVLTAKDLTASDFDRLNGRVARIIEKGNLAQFDHLAELVRTIAKTTATQAKPG